MFSSFRLSLRINVNVCLGRAMKFRTMVLSAENGKNWLRDKVVGKKIVYIVSKYLPGVGFIWKPKHERMGSFLSHKLLRFPFNGGYVAHRSARFSSMYYILYQYIICKIHIHFKQNNYI